MNNISKKHYKTFEDIRQYTKEGVEFWSARDLQTVLGYSSWDKFKLFIHKAMKACQNSQNAILDHFSQVGKIVKTGLGVERHVSDYDYSLIYPLKACPRQKPILNHLKRKNKNL